MASNKPIILCFFNTDIFSRSSNRFIHSIVIFEGEHVHERKEFIVLFSESPYNNSILWYIFEGETVFLK